MPEVPKSDLHPSWVPLEKNDQFACSVMGGIDSTVNANSEIKTYNEEAVIKVPLRKNLLSTSWSAVSAKGVVSCFPRPLP